MRSFLKIWKSAFVYSLYVGLCATNAAAQTSVIDLKQVYEAALQQDASIRASRAAADSGRERLPQARAGLLPQVSASAGRNNNNLDTTAPNILGNLSTTNELAHHESRFVKSHISLALHSFLGNSFNLIGQFTFSRRGSYDILKLRKIDMV